MEIAKSIKGAASQYFVAAELSRRGLVAALTLGNCPNTDILCSNSDATGFAHVQVKTFPLGKKKCMVGPRAEANPGRRFFWVLVGLPSPESGHPLEYYIIPARDNGASRKGKP